VREHLDEETNHGWFFLTTTSQVVTRKYNVDCSMTSGQKRDNHRTYILIPYKLFDEEPTKFQKEVEEWAVFGRLCGFPIRLLKENNVQKLMTSKGIVSTYDLSLYDTGRSWKDNAFIFEIDNKDLLSAKHGLACMTFIRHFYSSGANGDAYNVRNKTIELFNNEGLSPLDALLMSYWYLDDTWSGYYGFISSSQRVGILPTVATTFKRMRQLLNIHRTYKPDVISDAKDTLGMNYIRNTACHDGLFTNSTEKKQYLIEKLIKLRK